MTIKVGIPPSDLPASPEQLAEIRAGLGIPGARASVLKMVGFGASTVDGLQGANTITHGSCSLTSNVLTIIHASLGTGATNYIGEEVILTGLVPRWLNGRYKKLSRSTTQFTVECVGPNITAGNISADPTARWRNVSQVTPCSFYEILIRLARGRIQNMRNAGVGGATIEHMAERVSRDVYAYPDARVLFLAGANNLGLAGASGEAAAVWAKTEQLLEAILANGHQIELCAVLMVTTGYSGAVTYDVFNARATAYNILQAAWAATKSGRVAWHDTATPLQSGGNGIANYYQTDGVHLRQPGGLIAGRVVIDEMEAAGSLGVFYVPEGARRVRLALDTNGTAGTVNTGVTGTAATNVTLERNSGTPSAVASVVANDVGTYSQQLVITFSASGQGVRASMNVLPFVRQGEKWYVSYEVTTTGVNGSNLAYVHGKLLTNDGTAHVVFLDIDTVGSNVGFDQNFTQRYMHEIALPNGGALTEATLHIIFGTIASGTPSGDVTIELKNIDLFGPAS